MSLSKVISIVSQLPPQVNGVGDYAFCIAEKLEKDFGIETLFIRTEPSFEKGQQKFREVFLKKKNAQFLCDLLEANQSECILLHYVGYAYSGRGCPFWLVRGLELWKKRNSSAKVITVFHELFANGKLWESAFWFHFFQKNIVYRLLNISSGSITNSHITFQILRELNDQKHPLLIPVISNIGEPDHLTDFNMRDDVIVIFGSKEKRREIYTHSLRNLLFWTENLKIKKILEVGPVRNEKVNGAIGIEIVELGILSPFEVSSLFNKCKFGFIQYPLALLSKSGIFAAYASHGIVPLVVGNHYLNYESSEKKSNELLNGLKSGEHFLFKMISEVDGGEISRNVYNWYKGHDLNYLSTNVFELIKKD